MLIQGCNLPSFSDDLVLMRVEMKVSPGPYREMAELDLGYYFEEEGFRECYDACFSL